MMTDEAKTTATRHRFAAKIGAVVGLMLLVAYLGYEYGMTPLAPDVQKATASEIVVYIADPRGLNRQPQVEQQRFLEQWRDIIMGDAAKKEELKACFEKMEDDLRKAFSTEMSKHFKQAFLDDARMYASMPQDTKFAFLRERVAQYHERAVFLKEVAVGFSRQFKGTEDDMREWIMQNTTPEERAVGEPYAEALKRADEQVRKEHRAPTPPATSRAATPS